MQAKKKSVANGSRPRRGFRFSFRSIRLYLIVIVAILVLHEFDVVLSQMPVLEPQIPELVAEFQKKQADVWAEMNKLLVALATLTIGAVGGFILHRDKHARLHSSQQRRAVLSWLFCALSLYFGYLSYQQTTLLLNHGVFNPLSPRIWWTARAQFWTYLISMVLFADFIYGSTGSPPVIE